MRKDVFAHFPWPRYQSTIANQVGHEANYLIKSSIDLFTHNLNNKANIYNALN